MGTRAMISMEGKPFVATHWDGYPSSLGKDLLMCGIGGLISPREILEVASDHSINFADEEYLRDANQLMIDRLKENGQYQTGYGWLAEKNDQFVYSIKEYGDFAEYQYDFFQGQWRFREVNDEWTKATFGEWKDLDEITTREESQDCTVA